MNSKEESNCHVKEGEILIKHEESTIPSFNNNFISPCAMITLYRSLLKMIWAILWQARGKRNNKDKDFIMKQLFYRAQDNKESALKSN